LGESPGIKTEEQKNRRTEKQKKCEDPTDLSGQTKNYELKNFFTETSRPYRLPGYKNRRTEEQENRKTEEV
jgi:hypothetical protein